MAGNDTSFCLLLEARFSAILADYFKIKIIMPLNNFSGLVISWVYLRFYQMHANGSRGDTADGFAFASFFPNVIQPPVAVFGNTLFSLLGKD